MSNRVYFIYALVDPRDNSVRYVGITDNMAYRLAHHLRETGSRTLKGMWLGDLQRHELQPTMITLETIETKQEQRHIAEERERYWIHEFEQLGASLTNISKTTSDPRKSSESRSSIHHSHLISQEQDNPEAIYTLNQLRILAGFQVDELAKLAHISGRSFRKMARGESVGSALIYRVLEVLSERLGYKITPDMIKGLRALR